MGSPAFANPVPGLRDFERGAFAEAMQAWQAEAASGDASSGLYVGVLYDTGFGVAQNEAEALRWYERAGAAGNPTAMLNAAIMLDAGRAGAPDPQAAAAWYERAAARGVGRAEYNLALLLEFGAAGSRRGERAVQLYRAAASHGIAAAREHLARLGTPYAGTVRPSKDAAMLEFQRAQQVLLRRGAAEAAGAVELFRRAAQGGNRLAAYDLGYCYEHGIGVPVDAGLAIQFYRQAQEQPTDPRVRTMAEAGIRTLQSSISQSQR